MLLRASSKAVEQDVEVQATMGGQGAELVEHGEALVALKDDEPEPQRPAKRRRVTPSSSHLPV